MHKKIVPVLFIMIISALVVFFVSTKYLNTSDNASTEAVLVTPQVNEERGKIVIDTAATIDDDAIVSLLNLKQDESLVGVVSMDFDGDGYEDQVNAIKKSSSPYITILIGLYNSKKSEYERVGAIETKISQTRTFTYTGLDLTGDHRTALVFQGFRDNGNSVLQAYFITKKNGNVNINNIVNLEGDGSVYIQQLDRYDAYERSNAKGTSYPIWVYNSDMSNANSTDQLQYRYEWNSSSGKYELAETVRVAGSKIAAAELARIQDGTVDTFSNFLEGLWYKTNSDGSFQYLFFDKESAEIIFLLGESEEVYSWLKSTIRRNGMYVTTTNLDIENLQRRIDISLKTVDEIHLRIQDDVRMIISESNVWDGDYKKSGSAILSDYNEKHSEKKISNNLNVIEQIGRWKLSDGRFVDFSNGRYTVSGENTVSQGSYTTLTSSSVEYIQFRKITGEKIFDGTYLCVYSKASSESDRDIVSFQEYRVNPNGFQPAETRPITLTKSE